GHFEQWYGLGIALVKSNWAALGKQVMAAAVGEQPPPTPVEQPPAVANRNRNSNGNLEPFSVAVGHYLDWMRDVRKARIPTIADYKSKAQRFQKFANDPSLGAVTIEQPKAFLNEVEAEGVSAATVNFHYIVCKAVFEHARRERDMFADIHPSSD